MTILVEYSSNNSGGGWWLSAEDWIALYDAGWQLKRPYSECRYSDSGNASAEDEAHNWGLDPRSPESEWLGAITTNARKEFDSMREAVEGWESLTSGNAADEGCNCCGPPHYFSGTDVETGDYVSGPEIRVDSYLEW